MNIISAQTVDDEKAIMIIPHTEDEIQLIEYLMEDEVNEEFKQMLETMAKQKIWL